MGRRAREGRSPKSSQGICPVCRSPALCSLLVTHSPRPALLVSPCAGCSCPCSSGVVMRPPLFTAQTDSWLPQAYSLFPRVQPQPASSPPYRAGPDPDGLCRSCHGRQELGAMRVDTPPSFLLSPQPCTGQLCQRIWRSEEAEGQSSLFQGLDPSSGMTAGPTGEL